MSAIETVNRDDVVRRIAGENEQAVRMGLMFNKQTLESSDQPSTLDQETEGAIGIMSAAGDPLAEDEEATLQLLDGLNWSNQQVDSFLKVLAEGS